MCSFLGLPLCYSLTCHESLERLTKNVIKFVGIVSNKGGRSFKREPSLKCKLPKVLWAMQMPIAESNF